ncbi:MAG: hypothetical protein ACOYK8_10690 [Alphaproteobacteria bacterium]
MSDYLHIENLVGLLAEATLEKIAPDSSNYETVIEDTTERVSTFIAAITHPDLTSRDTFGPFSKRMALAFGVEAAGIEALAHHIKDQVGNNSGSAVFAEEQIKKIVIDAIDQAYHYQPPLLAEKQADIRQELQAMINSAAQPIQASETDNLSSKDIVLHINRRQWQFPRGYTLYAQHGWIPPALMGWMM